MCKYNISYIISKCILQILLACTKYWNKKETVAACALIDTIINVTTENVAS